MYSLILYTYDYYKNFEKEMCLSRSGSTFDPVIALSGYYNSPRVNVEYITPWKNDRCCALATAMDMDPFGA